MRIMYNYTKKLRLLSIVLLFLAILPFPYFYYQILRWVVSGSSFYTGWVLSEQRHIKWTWVFYIIGALFNPIAPFFLNRGTWSIIDIAVAIIFAFSLTKTFKSTNNNEATAR